MNEQHRDVESIQPESTEIRATSEPGSRKPWETPVLEELAVQLSSIRPGRGADGGISDCSLS